ncbi:MAG: peptidase S8 [Alphaproteobacteria bacterium]|nr:peptidase S8 [Alphaproteobacteria bacterium]
MKRIPHLAVARLAVLPLGLVAFVSGAEARAVERSGGVYHVAACAHAVGPTARCFARIVTDASGRIAVSSPRAIGGYTPGDLRDAYKIKGTGAPTTIVAAATAYGYTNAEADLGVYRAQFGLAACTTANGCFKKLNQNGVQGSYPAQNLGWAQEAAVDLDMASAMCPSCQIWLLEADTSSFANLAATVDTAASLGAHAISNSYGGAESGTTAYEPHYNHPGIAITASGGDSGLGGPQFPASSPHVTAVGGTHLVPAANARGWSETAIGGGGCSTVYAKPAWQTWPGCTRRVDNDVAAVGDPATGVAVYGPVSSTASGWMVFGGTSVSAPIIAGVYGVNGGAVTYGSDPYAHPTQLFDITAGTGAGPGYDPATGMGTPMGAGAFGP